MSTTHNGGNIQNTVTLEEHDGTLNAKRVNVVSGTITASSQVTVTPQIAWPDPKGYIGLVTATGNFSANLGNVTLNQSENWIGLATVYVGNPTLYAVVNTGAVGTTNSLVTLQASDKWIGLATVVTANGNTTLNSSPNYIGLVSVSGTVGLGVGNTTVGIVRFASPMTIGASANYIGLASVNVGGIATGSSFIGLATVVVGNAPILGASTNYIGLVTVANINRTITGNLTISDSKGFIGLTTAVNGQAWPDPKTYIGLVTATLSGTVNTGSSTIFPGPNQIGSVTVSNPITIGNAMVTVTLGTKLDSTNDSVDIKSGATVFIGGPTLFAQVNTSAATDPKIFIGLTTVTGSALDIRSLNSSATIFAVVNTGAVGNTNALATLLAGPNFIGLATVVVGNNPILGASTNYIGLVTVANRDRTITGNITLSDSKGFIGLVTLGGGTAWTDPKTFIGLATITHGFGNVTLNPSASYIGLVSANIGGIAAGANFIGLVTVAPINIAGSSRTFTTSPIAGNTSGNATVFVPTNKFYITQLLISATSVVNMTIRSGATYLVGNASIGVSLAANGGWVENGSPESPLYVGIANADAFVLGTNTLAPIAGHVTWYEA